VRGVAEAMAWPYLPVLHDLGHHSLRRSKWVAGTARAGS